MSIYVYTNPISESPIRFNWKSGYANQKFFPQTFVQCNTQRSGTFALPVAVQLGFHLAFCCTQNGPLCGFLLRPRIEGNLEQRTPQRSRCLEISNQGNKWSTPEMLMPSIKEMSAWILHSRLLIDGFHISSTAVHAGRKKREGGWTWAVVHNCVNTNEFLSQGTL